MSTEEIRQSLIRKQDMQYRDFQAKLIPTLDPKTIIGVRMPDLRKLAKNLQREMQKEMQKTPKNSLIAEDLQEFMHELPHQYYEENLLHGCFIETIRNYDECIRELELFLPYVDNWAVCDLISPKILGQYREKLLVQIKQWMASEHTYTVRFGIGMLMRYYLEEDFQPEYPEWVAEVTSDEYYVNMMRAWYFATALAKQYETVLPYIENHRLDVWTHNKTIQKAVESYRISAEQKTYLKSLKCKSR
jgi:3-methyladenine DNA glycosylase AlkD